MTVLAETPKTALFQLQPQVTLMRWQQDAVAAWWASRHPTRGPAHGIIEAVTGTGKTIAAIACIASAVAKVPTLRIAVVVPSLPLARQWQTELRRSLTIDPDEVGLRMTGHRASLRTHRIVVWVIDSARRSLAADCRGHDVMLVVDECHRAGSPANRAIFGAETRFRLGLSATAERRSEVGDDGMVLPLDQQPHAKALGPTVTKLTVANAEAMGILPPFRLVHHGLSLTEEEKGEYRRLSHNVTRALDEAQGLGLSGGAVNRALTAGAGGGFSPDQVAAAVRVQRALLARKHFLYLRPERARIAALLVAEALAERADGSQALLFHERIAPVETTDQDDSAEPEADDLAFPIDGGEVTEMGAEALFHALCEQAARGQLKLAAPPHVAIRRHHTQCPDETAFDAMRRPLGDPERAQVLVTVKGAVEGVDLPAADIGVVVASSSSVRQRIQTLGRILRPLRAADGTPLPRSAYVGRPPRTLHLLYIHDTVDAEIYQQTNWEELLGPDRNEFVYWPLGATAPEPDPAPPEPPPSDAEAAAWALAEIADAGTPVAWLGRRPTEEVQPLHFHHNAVRTKRDGPPHPQSKAIEAAIADTADVLLVPPTVLRGELHLRLQDGLIIRAVPQSLDTLRPVCLPGRRRPLPVRWLVVGQIATA